MTNINTAPFVLPALPYETNALAPCISATTLDFHYGKHHRAYVDKLNELVKNTEFADMKLEDLITKTSRSKTQSAIFNNAAQVWNHTFYWNSLSPQGGGKPSGELKRSLESSFGNYENFIKEFTEAGMTQFGSGWLWLVKEEEVLKIAKTSNAENPMSLGRGTALLTVDLWEHAYYLDFQNRRNDYLSTVLSRLIHWDFAAENFNQS